MVCQLGPEPPQRQWYRDYPANLPADYAGIQVFIVKVQGRKIYIPGSYQMANPIHQPGAVISRFKKGVKCRPNNYTYPSIGFRAMITMELPIPKDGGTKLQVDLDIIGWRWYVLRISDAGHELGRYGLNRADVSYHDYTRDRYGRIRKIKTPKNKRTGRALRRAWGKAGIMGSKLENVLRGALSPLTAILARIKEESRETVTVNVNIEQYMSRYLRDR